MERELGDGTFPKSIDLPGEETKKDAQNDGGKNKAVERVNHREEEEEKRVCCGCRSKKSKR